MMSRNNTLSRVAGTGFWSLATGLWALGSGTEYQVPSTKYPLKKDLRVAIQHILMILKT